MLGTVVAAIPATTAGILAVSLAARAAGWPVSVTLFVAILGAIALGVLALLFAFWAYACHRLRYAVDHNGLTIVWGTLKHFIPMDRIQTLTLGRGGESMQMRGLSWPGLHVGHGLVDGHETIFYSTHRTPEEILYVRTETATYALSPLDPPRFVVEVERFRQAAQAGGSEAIQRDVVGGHPIWADRIAQWLALAAVVINVALWGYIFAIYRDLAPQITIEFPPIGDITELHSRDEILKIPAAALAVLAVNLVVGFAIQWRERAATYLLLSGSVFVQLLFWVSAGIAVSNA
jgi:hypothetical protein